MERKNYVHFFQRKILTGSGSENTGPDPDSTNSSGSEQIRFRKTALDNKGQQKKPSKSYKRYCSGFELTEGP